MTKQIVTLGLVAAIYVIFTLAIQPLSYGPIQFRLGELLMVLPFINKKYSYGIIVGVFIANIASPIGVADMIIGTAHTAVMCYFVAKLKNIWLIPPLTAVITSVMIGWLLLYVVFGIEGPLWWIMVTVGFGEFVVVAIGVIIFKIIEKKNPYFYDKLENI